MMHLIFFFILAQCFLSPEREEEKYKILELAGA